MTEKEILEAADKAGIDFAAFVNAEEMVFELDFRKYCEMNVCGKFGENYGCPPDCGTAEEMRDKARAYKRALVLQTVQQVKDVTDSGETGPLKKRHNGMLRAFIEQLELGGIKGLAMMAGPCSPCPTCGKSEGVPCRFADKVTSCLSAYGVNVMELCKTSGLQLDYGEGKVALFGIYMI